MRARVLDVFGLLVTNPCWSPEQAHWVWWPHAHFWQGCTDGKRTPGRRWLGLLRRRAGRCPHTLWGPPSGRCPSAILCTLTPRLPPRTPLPQPRWCCPPRPSASAPSPASPRSRPSPPVPCATTKRCEASEARGRLRQPSPGVACHAADCPVNAAYACCPALPTHRGRCRPFGPNWLVIVRAAAALLKNKLVEP